MDKPNILFVFTDQQTLDAMSCAGRAGLHTPNMDRLAAEGVRFRRSYCTSPVCGPSRASMITGLMPHTHGLIYNHDERFRDSDATRLPTFADHLRDAGYAVHWTGKWHAQEFYPNRGERIHGFDFLPINADGFVGLGLDMDAAVTRRAAEFLENAPAQPWFLGVAWHNPHDICYWIMDEYRDRLDPVTDQGGLPELPANFEVSPDEPEFFRLCRQRREYGMEMRWTPDWNQTKWREYLRAYHRLVEVADAELGKLLDALDRAGLADKTLVVFTSDHGEGCAGHRFVVKLTPYEEAVAVPLIARLPGVIPAGGVCDSHIASGIDLLPTFCDFAGAVIRTGLPGRSLKPFLMSPEAAGRDFAVSSVDPDPGMPELSCRMVRTREYKYIAFSMGEPAEALYDLAQDPGETRNVAADPAHQAALARHREILAAWKSETRDPFPSQP
jgi:arylsulfatase A-like enzyme